MVICLIFYTIYTERGTRYLWQAAVALSGGRLNGALEGGTLHTGIQLRHFDWRDAKIGLHVDSVRSQWQWTLSPKPWRFVIDFLQIGTVDLRIAPSPSSQTKLSLPKDLILPLQLEVRHLRIDRVRWHQGGSTNEINHLVLHARTDGRHHEVTVDQLVSPVGEVQASFQLEGVRPFSLVGDSRFSGKVRDKAMRLDAHLSGSLQAPIAQIKAEGIFTGSAHIEATPFDRNPLKVITLSVCHLNPQTFSNTTPAADLSLQAKLQSVQNLQNVQKGTDLTPTNAETEREANVAQFMLVGPVSIVNARPGALNARLLPLIDVHAKVQLTARKQTFSDLQIRLIKHALWTGDGWFAIYHDHFNYAIDTTLKHFSPWLLFRSPKKALQTTRLSGKLKVSGTLAAPATKPVATTTKPKSTAKSTSTTVVTYALHASRYGNRPLTGAGTVKLMGTHLLPSDAQLSIAGNKFAVRGSFGEVGDRLVFRINAPQLKQLGFGLSGAAYAAGDVRGTLAHPYMTANVQANALILGANRVGYLRGQTKWRDGVNGTMALTVNAHDLIISNTALQGLSVHLSGTRAKHVLAAKANGLVAGRPIDLNMAAHGGLTHKGGDIHRWDGVITQFVNQVPLHNNKPIVDRGRSLPVPVRLKSPVTLSAELNHLTITTLRVGTMRLFIDQATLYLRTLVYDRGAIRSAGSLTGIHINRLLEVVSKTKIPCHIEQCDKPSGSSSAIHTDLVLDSDWDFSIGRTTAKGYWRLQRRLGDLSFETNGGLAALNIQEITARLSFSNGNRAHLAMHAKSARLGILNADLQTLLTHMKGRLVVTSDTAWSGQMIATIPSLKTIGDLLGPKYVLDGNVSLKLAMAGSLGKPTFSGMLVGDRLSATLIDAGVTLKDGIVHIAISDNLVEFRRVEFHGASGILRTTGHIRLDRANPADLSAQIIADKFEPFAVPYRQLSLSGQANIVNSDPAGMPAINGQFTVNHALFDLPAKSTPQLSDDVQIVRMRSDLQSVEREQSAERKSGGEPLGHGWMPRADVHIDFGRNFRFRGVGANLKLRGALNVISVPGKPLRALGDLRMLKGSTYEIFGRKLGIEKGYFVFNGPINNPGINILALRRNQEVEAGVAVTGTVARPNVKLVSEPNVPDDEKLSWLLFGHGTNSGMNLGQQSTMTAAFALLGSAGSKRIAHTLGVDEFSVGQSESGLTDPQVVSLAKAINERLILGYEQGLTSAANLFKVTWQISRAWSLAVHTGTLNGVDLIFTRHFD